MQNNLCMRISQQRLRVHSLDWPGVAYTSKFLVGLLPAWKKPAVNIKEIPRNARIKFSFFLWNFLFSFYFCHYDDII